MLIRKKKSQSSGLLSAEYLNKNIAHEFSGSTFIVTAFLLVGVVVLFFFSIHDSIHADDFLPQGLIAVTLLAAGLMFCREIAREGLSAWAVFLFFMFCFYGVLPLLCFRSGLWLFGDISLDNRSGVLVVGALAFFFLCAAAIGRLCARKISWKFPDRVWGALSRRVFRDEFSFLMPLVQITSVCLLVLFLGKDVLLLRSGGSEIAFDSFWVVVILNFIRPLSFFPFCMYIIVSRGRWDYSRLVFAFALGLLALLGNLPTSTPRFYLFMLLTVLLYSLFYGAKYWRIAGLLFLFFGFFAGVITDQFRHLKNISEVSDISLDLGSYLTAGHFDAFEMNVYAVDYADKYGLENGRQALGVVGFWVPRIFWNNKPVPTGVLLGSEFIGGLTSTRNTNLSCPAPAEAYIDFGVIGVVLYGVLTGVFIGRLDKSISDVWLKASPDKMYRGPLIISMLVLPVLVGMTLFLARGSLMPAFAYTMGSFSSAFILYVVFTRKVNV